VDEKPVEGVDEELGEQTSDVKKDEKNKEYVKGVFTAI